MTCEVVLSNPFALTVVFQVMCPVTVTNLGVFHHEQSVQFATAQGTPNINVYLITPQLPWLLNTPFAWSAVKWVT
jgi:hypothetical protein